MSIAKRVHSPRWAVYESANLTMPPRMMIDRDAPGVAGDGAIGATSRFSWT
jgi:hypothetical protein